MNEVTSTGRVSRRARHKLDELHDKGLNFDLAHREEYTPANGWHVDDYRKTLPSEPPGQPLADGSWAACRRLMVAYEFADPRLVRAVYYADEPLEDRNMLLEGRFFGLRFLLGLRVGGVNDTTGLVDGRPVRRWGWNYRTLQGHLEMGQMDYEVWKWLDSGEVAFRIHAFSKPAEIPNPVVRLGFAVFGRVMQRLFALRALQRMERLVCARLLSQSTERSPDGEQAVLDTIAVRPASATARTRQRLERSRGETEPDAPTS